MPSGTTSSDLVRVLLVDDNQAMLNRASTALASGCLVVGTVHDGPSALHAAEASYPDTSCRQAWTLYPSCERGDYVDAVGE